MSTLSLLAMPVVANAVEESGTTETPSAKPLPAFVIQDHRITESSGLTRSTWRDSLYYTHNDSGDVPRVFAIDSTGSTVSVLHLRGARNIDWEDIATGPRHSLWVADTGNDRLGRQHVAVYRFREPRSLDKRETVRPTKYQLRYPGRTQDSGALLVKPHTGRVLVVTQGEDGGAVYRAPRRLSSRHMNKMVRVASAPADVTGAAFAPDGSGFVLGTLSRTYEYRHLGGQPLVTDLDTQLTRSESVTYTADSSSVLAGSEGLRSPVFAEQRRIGNTEEPPPSETPTPTPTTPAPTTPAPTTPAPTTPAPTTPPPTPTTVSVIPVRASWAYRYQAAAPTGDWNLDRYDDSSWSRGPAPIGFGSSTVATDIDVQPTTERPRTAYFRKAFNLTNADAIGSVTLTTRADDGVAVYVNGVEVLRSNLIPDAEDVDYADSAVSTANASPVRVVVPGSAFHDGYNTITAETHVNYRATNDMTFDLSAVASVPGTQGLPVVTPPVVETPPPAGGPGDLPGWHLDLADDFDSFDTATWHKYDQEAWDRDSGYVLGRNATVANGMMRIQAKPEAVGGRQWTTGDVTSRGHYSLPDYFRVEVRAKVPLEHGMWAAPIWFRPDGPEAGEIDLVETYGVEQDKPYVHQTIHTDYGDAHKQTHIFTPFSRYPGAATDWHTYTIEKTPGQMVMWVDGIKSATFNKANTPWYDTYYEAGTRWSLRSCLQVGGTPEELPDATTDWSGNKTSMLIDHVYTWTMK